jgi:hypothetical protein
MPDPIYDAEQSRQMDYDDYLEARARFEPIVFEREPMIARTKHGLTSVSQGFMENARCYLESYRGEIAAELAKQHRPVEAVADVIAVLRAMANAELVETRE